MYKIKIFNKNDKKTIFKGIYNKNNNLSIHLNKMVNYCIYLMNKKDLEFKTFENKGIRIKIKKID